MLKNLSERSRADYIRAVSEVIYTHMKPEEIRETRRTQIFLLIRSICRDIFQIKSMYATFTYIKMEESTKNWISRAENLVGFTVSGKIAKAFVGFSEKTTWPEFKKLCNCAINADDSSLEEESKKIFRQYSGFIMVWQKWILDVEERIMIDPLSFLTHLRSIKDDDDTWKYSPSSKTYTALLEEDITKSMES